MVLYNFMQPIIIFSQILGGFPFKLRQKSKNHFHRFLISKILLAYSLMIFVTVIGNNSHVHVQWFTGGGSTSFIVSGIASSWSFLISYITTILTWFFPFRSIFRSFETLLASYQRFNIDGRQENNFIRRIMVQLIFGNFVLAMYTVSVLFSNWLETLEIEVYCSYVVILAFIYITDVQFIAFVLILNNNFSGINLQLIKSLNYQVKLPRRNWSQSTSMTGIKLSSGGRNFPVRV